MNPKTHVATAAAAAADPSIFGFLFWSEVDSAALVEPEDLFDALDANGFDASWRVPPVAALAVFTREAKKAARKIDGEGEEARYLVLAPLKKTKKSSSFVCYLSRRGDKATSTGKADAVGALTCDFSGVSGSVSWIFSGMDRQPQEDDAAYTDRRISLARSHGDDEKIAAFEAFSDLAASISIAVDERGGKIDGAAITDLFRRALSREELVAAPTRKAGAPYFVPNLPARNEANPIKMIAALAAVVEGVVEGAFGAVIPLHKSPSNVEAVARPIKNGLEANAAELLAELEAASKGKADYLANRARDVEALIDRAEIYRDLFAARLDTFEARVEAARAEIARLVALKAGDVEAQSEAASTSPEADLDGLDDLDLD